MKKLSPIASMFALSMSLAAPAHAQNTAPQGSAATPDGLEEIVVTTQKRAQNVQDVPIAISAFTSAALQERAVGDVSALSGLAPNVTLDAGTPFSGSKSVLGAYIRGIGAADFAFNLDPGVGVYLDGVYLARSIGANQDLPDVERIEVLKGPQGTLFGRNTIGGAISIVTRDPAREFGFQGDVTGGSYQRMQIRASADIPITETLRSSLTFSMIDRKGYQRRIPYDAGQAYVIDGATSFPAAGYESHSRQGGDNSWSLRGKLKWDNDGRLRVTISGDYINQDQEAMPGSVLATTENVPGAFGGLTENSLGPAMGFPIQTGLDVVTGTSGFLFGGLYNFCIGSTAAQITARKATNMCGPRTGVNGYNTLPGLASVNVDGNPLNNRLPWDNRWVNTDKDTTYATGPNFSKLKQGGLNGTVEFDLLDSMTIKSITSWRFVDFSAGTDMDNSPLEFYHLSFFVNQKQFSQEVQITGSALGDSLNYVLGGYYFNEWGTLNDYVTFAEGLLQVNGPATVKTKNYATFGQVDWRVNELIGITLGGRYTHERKQFEGAQSDVNGFNYKLFNCVPAGAACAPLVDFPNPDQPFRYYVTGVNKQSFSNFAPKAIIQLHPSRAVMAYGSWSRGYKTGGWTTRLSNPLPDAPSFGPEKAETFELGVKSELIDRTLQVNIAAFTTRYQDIQLTFQEGVSPTIRNAGTARIKGVEIESTWAPTRGLALMGSVGYIDAYYSDVAAQAQVTPSAFQSGVYAGAELPKSPHWKVNFSPRYETRLGAGSLVALADWTFTSRMRNDTEGTLLLDRPGTNIVNASISYRSPGRRYELTIGGTNLTNERYLTTGQLQTTGGLIIGTYSRPAEWYARLGVKF